MWLLDLLIIITGLFIGSFLNVVALRMLQGKSVVYPPSHCPHCHVRLGVVELIPVVGYLWNKGRCRHCQAPISKLYPLGELMTATSFYAVYLVYGLSAEMGLGLLLVALLVTCMITDLKSMLILNRLTLPAIGLFFALRLFIGPEPWWFYLSGGLLGFGVLLLLARLSKGGMGGGDVKLFAAIGMALGPGLLLLSLIFSSFAGALTGAILLLTGTIKRRQPVPFAPFIFVGTLSAYLWGSVLWEMYTRLF